MNADPDQTTISGRCRRLAAAQRHARPSKRVDDRLKSYARTAAQRSRWVWPVSLAASALLCVGATYQLAQILTPSPMPPPETLAAPAPAMAPLLQPAVFEATPGPDVGARLRPIYELSSAQDWWQQLRLHAAEADREAFLATWQAYQQYQRGVPLPDDLRLWIAAHRLLPPPAHSG